MQSDIPNMQHHASWLDQYKIASYSPDMYMYCY